MRTNHTPMPRLVAISSLILLAAASAGAQQPTPSASLRAALSRPLPVSAATVLAAPNAPPDAAPQEGSRVEPPGRLWRVTLASGEAYSGVGLSDLNGDRLVVMRDGDTAMIPVEQISELRRLRAWSTWRTIGFGAMAGGVAGYITGALSKSETPASTFLGVGLASGALIGYVIGQIASPKDDIYDLSAMTRLERSETIQRLLTR